MSETDSSDRDVLVALLDGEIEPDASEAIIARLGDDAALRDRFARLERGGQGVRPAFDSLMSSAPLDRLDAILDRAIAETDPPKATGPLVRDRRPWQLLRFALAPALAAIVAGLAGLWIGYASFNTPAGPPETWREAVAEYWRLTTPDTLAIEPTADHAARELQLAGERLGLPLAMQNVTLPDASFRGASIFDFAGRPLTQIAYLNRGGEPIAFCLITDPNKRETPPTAIVMDGFNVVHWASGGYARMLIGRVPEETLKRYAALLIDKTG
jgi:anti-sigma factor RsiW